MTPPKSSWPPPPENEDPARTLLDDTAPASPRRGEPDPGAATILESPAPRRLPPSFKVTWRRSSRLNLPPPSASPAGHRPFLSEGGTLKLAEGAQQAVKFNATASGMTIERVSQDVEVRVNQATLPLNVPVVFDPRRANELQIGEMPAVGLEVRGDQVELAVPAARPVVSAAPTHLQVNGVTFDLWLRQGDKRHALTLVDDVTFTAAPGELIAVMGDSGAGKSSLFALLSGERIPTRGSVRVNGRDLHAGDAPGLVAMVPQDDLVHGELTVREAVRYAARIRLPGLEASKVDARVDAVLVDLGLYEHRDTVIGTPARRGISGGQRKRVNIAIELVGDAPVLLLDEPTSGLASSDAAELVMLLDDLARHRGKTILTVIHQPSRREYERFARVIILGHGGRRIFEGTPRESYGFFDRYRARTNPEGAPVGDAAAVFECIRKRRLELEAQYPQGRSHDVAAQRWREEFEREWRPLHPAPPVTAVADAVAAPPRLGAWQAWKLLAERYVRVKRRDRGGLAVTAAQPLLIGVALAAVFRAPTPRAVAWCHDFVLAAEQQARCVGANPGAALGRLTDDALKATDHTTALLFLVLSALWCGTSNAAREVVSERAIYRRESMAGVGRAVYLLSKLGPLALVAVTQCFVMLAIVAPALGLAGGDPGALVTMFAGMALTSVGATALGLLTSTVASSEVAAMALTPILLIPQVVLAGSIVRMTEKPWLSSVMWWSPSRWGFQWLASAERLAVERTQPGWLLPTCASPGERFACATREFAGSELGAMNFGEPGRYLAPTLWLAAFGALCFAAAWGVLGWRDRRAAHGR